MITRLIWQGKCRYQRLLAVVGANVLAVALWGYGPRVQAQPIHEGFVIGYVETTLKDNVYNLDARIYGRLSEQVVEALHKGVTITIVLDFEVWRKRRFWLDERIAAVEQRYQLQYHALSDQYIVSNVNTEVRNSYPSLATAIEVLGTVKSLPVLDRQLLDPSGRYMARMRTRLDVDALPAPLRIMAYILPGWHLRSEWYTWRLRI